jgi:hypothetical protein
VLKFSIMHTNINLDVPDCPIWNGSRAEIPPWGAEAQPLRRLLPEPNLPTSREKEMSTIIAVTGTDTEHVPCCEYAW